VVMDGSLTLGSVTSVSEYAGLGAYGASLGGIKQLTMSLADDWGKYGVTANCLAPGWFRTQQNEILYQNAAARRWGVSTRRRESAIGLDRSEIMTAAFQSGLGNPFDARAYLIYHI
jgi:NAD(P)-dependent dehydrogenase (short-subunit alcohol dehydrogenase family)